MNQPRLKYTPGRWLQNAQLRGDRVEVLRGFLLQWALAGSPRKIYEITAGKNGNQFITQTYTIIPIHLDFWGDYSDLIRRTETIVLSIIEVEFQFLHLDIFEHPDLLIRMRTKMYKLGCYTYIDGENIDPGRRINEQWWTAKFAELVGGWFVPKSVFWETFWTLGYDGCGSRLVDWRLSVEAPMPRDKGHTHNVSILGTDWTITLYDLSWETLQGAGKRDYISDSTTMTIPWVASHCTWRQKDGDSSYIQDINQLAVWHVYQGGHTSQEEWHSHQCLLFWISSTGTT